MATTAGPAGAGEPALARTRAAAPTRAAASNPLRQLDAALKELTAKVSPAVVQILATGYGPVAEPTAGQGSVVARQQGVGSGVILDASGYIVTNAHVVKGAERVQVIFTKSDFDPNVPLPPAGEQSMLPARVVGLSDYFDVALLKVEATGLPTLPLADFRTVTQGQVVLAVGSPLGMDNSITMGVISAVARQARPESPVVYVQTDAPINPGNSGGALVDVDGHLVGINTFIISQTGGNEGLGFALPAPIVALAYKSLREKGHVDRRVIGLGIQRITPAVARGLGLARAFGLLVCDVLPGGAGEEAGVKIGDILVEADGRAILTPSQLDGSLYIHDLKEPMTVGVLRDGAKVALAIRVREQSHQADSLIDTTDPEKNLVPQLGLLAATVTAEMRASLGGLRIQSGVAVVALTTDAAGLDLRAGDVIHAVNGASVADIDALRAALAQFKHGDAVVLQVERQGGLEFVAFELS